ETYAGGPEVGPWQSVSMSSSDVAPPANILAPAYRALRYGGMITGQRNELLDYYVEAVDGRGNIARSDIQHVWVGDSATQSGGDVVQIVPNPAIAGQSLAVTYNPLGRPLAGASQVYVHYGFNNWQTISPDVLMNWDAEQSRWNVNLPISQDASQFDLVFNNGAGTWDNNSGQDWHFNVTGTQSPAFVMDGVRDASAKEVASNGARHLYAALSGDTLYVATEDAGEGNDVFIYLAKTPGQLVAANWAKAGQIAKWDAYLADENDNDYKAWFDATGATQAATGANGGVLEGTINLAQEFGSLPSEIYLAVGVYQTADGGALVASQQVPASIDENGNINALEYFLLQLVAAPGDFNQDGHVDAADFDLWRTTFGTADTRADANADGTVDGADYIIWRKYFGTAAAASYVLVDSRPAVPEPTSFCLLILGAVLVGWQGRRLAVRLPTPAIS
ncbi:MAG TPA: carbohydrate-binding protein, partial [Lacipirellulaceae bacterium]|nr:carbohydrate-binding protein [Lacipirellulaceae bacterium]